MNKKNEESVIIWDLMNGDHNQKHKVCESHLRSIFKGITAKAMEVIVDFVVINIFLNRSMESFGIAMGIEFFCYCVNYVNERMWLRFSYGRKIIDVDNSPQDSFWIYIASFLDGEGYIVKRKTRTNDKFPIIGLSQVKPKVLEVIREFLSNNEITTSFFSHRSGINNSLCWHLTVNRHEDKIKFLENVIPFMIVKKKLAEEALHWLKFERKIKRKSFSDFQISEIIRAFKTGRKCEDLGFKYGCNARTIGKLLQKNGVNLRTYSQKRNRNKNGRFLTKSIYQKIIQWGRKITHKK